MLQRIKGFSVGLQGFGSNVSGKALGGQNLQDISFISVAPEYSVALDKRGKVKGWGKNISGTLNINNLNNLNFKSISAGYDHVVGVLESYDSFPIYTNRFFSGSSPLGKYSCFTGHTGSWSSPVWLPGTSSDPYTGFAKEVVITGYFNAGLVVKKYPTNEILIEDRRNFNYNLNYFSGDFYLNTGESYYLELTVPCLPIVSTSVSQNYWSVSAIASERRIDSGIANGIFTGWGADYSGQVSGGLGLKNLKKVSAGNAFSLALFEDGTVTGWGSNHKSQISNLEYLSGIVDISAGADHSLFLDLSGNVFSRGSNDFGQRNINIEPNSSALQVSAGRKKSIILYKKEDDFFSRVFATGDESFENLKYLNSIQSVSHVNAGYNGFIATFEDGSVVGVGDEYCGEFNFSGVKNAIYGFNGNKFSQVIYNKGVINTNFLELKAGFDFIGGSDQVIKSLNIDTAIKKKIQNISDVNFLKKDKSNFAVNFYSGVNSTVVSNSFLKISGGSLKNRTIPGKTFSYKYLNDPVLEVSNGANDFLVDDWISDVAFSDVSYKNQIINSGYIDPLTFSEKDPFLSINHKVSDAYKANYFFKIDDKNSENTPFLNLEEEPSRFVFSWNNLPSINNQSTDYISSNKAFLIYDNRSGTTSKNVFAYAIELEKTVYPAFTQFQSDSFKQYYYLPLLKVQPQIINGWHSFISTFSSVCVQQEGCESKEPKPEEMCVDGAKGKYFFPGGGTGKTDLPPTGSEYDKWVLEIEKNFRKNEKSGINSSFNSNLYSQGLSVGNFNSNTIFNGSSGIILFGDFFSGDRLVFSPYNLGPLGYTGLYRSLYLQNPPYKQLPGFTLQFKKDFSDPSGLFNALKANFSGYINDPQKTGYLWYWGVGCNTGQGETGFFEKVDSSLADVFYIPPSEFFSGANEETLKYWSGRIIGYRANYFHQSGYSLKLEKNTRTINIDTGRVDGFKFVLPSKVSLYGSQDAVNWKMLDSRYNVKWDAIKPTERSVDVSYFNSDFEMSREIGNLSGYSAKNVFDEIFAKTGFKMETGSFSISGVPADPHYRARDLFTMTKTYVEQDKPFCEPLLVEKTLPVYYAGSGISCKEKEEDDQGDEEGDEEGDEDGSGDEPLILESIRTGWLIDFDKLSVSQNEIFNLNLNYLKIEFEDFKSPVELYGLNPVEWFHVKNINFFSLAKENPELKTGIKCWDGGSYEIIPSGYVPVNISGSFTADVREMDSGIRKFDSASLSGKIVGLSAGDYIKFNKLSGKLLSDTGYAIYNGSLYASGQFCTGFSDWFYNKDTKIIDTFKSFCSEFTSGSGFFSGSYLRIKPEIVNRDLAFGKFLNPSYEVNFETGVVYTGLFYSSDYVSGYTGYLKIPYSITGFSSSGYINFNKQFVGSAFGSGIRVSNNPTGYSTSNAWIKVREHLLTEGDFISLNGNDIFYNIDSVNAGPPDYFNNFASLCDIFTGDLYSSLFNCSFEIDDFDNSILIKALPLGDSGNNIGFNFNSASGGISGVNGKTYNGFYLTGGKSFYQYIDGTGDYIYNLNLSGYPITGFYYLNSGSGFISGPVKTYQGERDFTGVWSLATGVSAFLQNLILVSGSGNMFSGKYIEDELGTYPERLKISVGYQDKFNLGGKDVAVLSVFDENYIYNNNLTTGSGVSIIIENY